VFAVNAQVEDFGLRPGVFLLVAIAYTGHRLLRPWHERKGMWSAVHAVVFPWRRPAVTFFHTYTGDVLTSMVKCFLNVLYTLCFVASGDVWLARSTHAGPSPEPPLDGYAGGGDSVGADDDGGLFHGGGDGADGGDAAVAADEGLGGDWKASWWYGRVCLPLLVFLPLWWRFVQCLLRFKQTGKRWPHQFNAGKYGLMMVVTVFGALHPLYTTIQPSWGFQAFWVGLFVVSTLYST